ncbi:hypothetical protein Tco_0222620 [Tanacetum coccineum]
MLSTIIIPAEPATDDSLKVPERTTVETLLNISHASTKHKGKEIAKPITPPSESASEEDSDPEQAQRDKDMQKNLALIAKYEECIYQTGKYGNFKDCCWARETLRQSSEKGVTLKAEKADWLEDTDEEIDEQELEAHYSYMKKIQEVPITDSGLILSLWKSNVIPDSHDMYDNDIQTDQNIEECDDVRVALANLIANLKLDIDENKKDSKAIKESKCITGSRIERVQIYY